MFKANWILTIVTLLFFILETSNPIFGKNLDEVTKQKKEAYKVKKFAFYPMRYENRLKQLEITTKDMYHRTIKSYKHEKYKLEVDEFGNVQIFDDIDHKVIRYSKDATELPSLFYHEKAILAKRKISSNYQHEIYRKEPNKTAIRIKNKYSNTIAEIELNYDPAYLELLGVDKDENLYLLLDNTFVGALGPEDWKLEVHKYSKEGNFLSKIELQTDFIQPRTGQKDRVSIDIEGNIYQLIRKQDGIHLIKWEKTHEQ